MITIIRQLFLCNTPLIGASTTSLYLTFPIALLQERFLWKSEPVLLMEEDFAKNFIKENQGKGVAAFS